MDSKKENEESGRPYNIRHRAFFFAKDVILFVKESKYERIYFSLFDQLIRSATSIGANLVEGRAGSSRKDWKNFLMIALKSANETKYWLCLIRDSLGADRNRIEKLVEEADEIAKIIGRIILNAS